MAPMYLRPAAEAEFHAELEIKRSKFLCFLRRATNEEEARAFVADLKARYPDARHHCSAFIYAVEGQQPVERSSDDGEPSGTAGQPMLDVLRGSGLSDVAAVVVRYFGGIKLGAGGLVHAYSEAVSLGLEQVQVVRRDRLARLTLVLDHAQAGRVEAELRAQGIRVLDVAYERSVTLTLAVDPEHAEQLHGTVAALTAGGAELQDAGSCWVEHPLECES